MTTADIQSLYLRIHKHICEKRGREIVEEIPETILNLHRQTLIDLLIHNFHHYRKVDTRPLKWFFTKKSLLRFNNRDEKQKKIERSFENVKKCSIFREIRISYFHKEEKERQQSIKIHHGWKQCHIRNILYDKNSQYCPQCSHQKMCKIIKIQKYL